MSTNRYTDEYAGFVEQTKDHVLTVVQDAGLCRRLHMGVPGTGMWSWTVVTWPGYLATVGDIADGYVFSRVTDMVDFFSLSSRSRYDDGTPMIDLRYWAEKVQGPARDSARVYSDKAFLAWVSRTLDEHDELGTEAIEQLRSEIAEDPEDESLRDALETVLADRQEVLDDARANSESEHEAVDWVYRQKSELVGDPCDADLRDWDVHFLYACWAIEMTVRAYREHVAEHGAGDGFALVRGGLVQNDTGFPVYDLDVLDSDLSDEEALPEVVDLFGRMVVDPNRRATQFVLEELLERIRATGSAEDVEAAEAAMARRGSYE